MKNFKSLFIIVFLFTFSFSVGASQIYVDNTIINIKSKEEAKTVSIKKINNQKNVYVSTFLREIKNPNEKSEYCLSFAESKKCKRVDNVEDLGLITTPNKLVLGDKSFKKIRIYNLNENLSSEKVYRLEILPVNNKKLESKNNHLALKIQMGYEVLIIVEPEKLKYSFNYKLEGNKLKINNSGNVNILFFEGKECNKEICRDLEVKRIYAGGHYNYDLKWEDSNVNINIMKGKKVENIIIER